MTPSANEGGCSDCAGDGEAAATESGLSGSEACVAAGGQCVVGVAFCGNVGPGATAKSCQASDPDMLCCGIGADAACTTIAASKYDQTCSDDSDCTQVGVGNACQVCDLSCQQTVDAINRDAMAQYAADIAKTPAGAAVCGCPALPPPVACCLAGRCHAGNACAPPDSSAGSPPDDASSDGPQDARGPPDASLDATVSPDGADAASD
jgi:hypothetical protein